jgi:alcohol dehydrogenase class IV
MQFEFSTVTKIIFGSGKLNSIGDLIAGMGDRVLIVFGGPHSTVERLQNLLNKTRVITYVYKINGEPTVEVIRETLNFARQISANLVIGIGGGSALDTAKAVSALITNPGDVIDYLEVIGQNRPLTHPSIPLIAIPTTAGTGTEVSRNAVIGVPQHLIKVSMRSVYLLPKLALVDPELTLSVPPDITAFTGLDALTQLIEPFTCNNPNPLTDALCIEGMKHLQHSFRRAYANGDDLAAREDMSLASLFSGLAMANAKLGAVHGFAGPIGGEISAHHGAVCAILLPWVMQTNINALTDRAPGHPALARYASIAQLLSGNSKASINTGIEWVRDVCKDMHIQPLSKYGLIEDQFPTLIEKAKISSSMKGNPITLSDDELRNILQRLLERLG